MTFVGFDLHKRYIAACACARKLVCYIYWMLKEGWTYPEWLQQHQESRRPEVRPIQRAGAMA